MDGRKPVAQKKLAAATIMGWLLAGDDSFLKSDQMAAPG
jgi:hypothetical protein